MAGLDVTEGAVAMKQAEKHGCVFADIGMFAEKLIDLIEDTHWVSAADHAGKRALQHGGEHGRAQAVAGDIGNEDGGLVFTHGIDIEVIAADGDAGVVDADDGEMRKVVVALGQESLLNAAGDGELMLQEPPLALALHVTRIFEDAGRLGSEGVKDVANQRGKCGGMRGVEIDDADKLTALRLRLIGLFRFADGLAGRNAG